MKVFVVMLLLANASFWAWEFNSLAQAGGPAAPQLEAPFVQAGRDLRLLTELPVLPREIQPISVVATSNELDAVQALDSEVTTPPLVIPEPWCAATGVLARSDDAAAFLSEWEQVGGVGEVASDKEVVSSTWWVYLPPFPGESEARVILNELQQKKIDSYYMRNGELAGGISLGVFSREVGARKYQDELRQKGYITEIHEIPRLEERSRLYLILESGAPVNGAAAAQVLSKFGSIHMDEIPCK